MWNLVLEKLLVPLLLKAAELIYKRIEHWLEDKRIKDKIKDDLKKMKEAKTSEEVRNIHRNSTRI